MTTFNELDENKFDCDHLLEIPHKNEIDLGHELVAEFVEEQMVGELDRVREIFSRRGACRRFKDLLEHRGRLQSWYDFENRREQEALWEWCREKKITLPPA